MSLVRRSSGRYGLDLGTLLQAHIPSISDAVKVLGRAVQDGEPMTSDIRELVSMTTDRLSQIAEAAELEGTWTCEGCGMTYGMFVPEGCNRCRDHNLTPEENQAQFPHRNVVLVTPGRGGG